MNRLIYVLISFQLFLCLPTTAQNAFTWVRCVSNPTYTYPKEEFPGYKFYLTAHNDGKGNFHTFSSYYYDGYTSLNEHGEDWKDVLDTNCNVTGPKESVNIMGDPGSKLPSSVKFNYRGEVLINYTFFGQDIYYPRSSSWISEIVVKRKDGSTRCRYSISATSNWSGPQYSVQLGYPAFDSSHAVYFYELNTFKGVNALTKMDSAGNLKWSRQLNSEAGIGSVIHCPESNILYMSINSPKDTVMYDSVQMVKRGTQQLIVKLDTSGHVISWKPILSAINFLSNSDGLIWCSVVVVANDTMKFDTVASIYTGGNSFKSIYALMDTATNWKFALMIQNAQVNGNGGLYIGNKNKLYLDLVKKYQLKALVIVVGLDTLASDKYFVAIHPNGTRTCRNYKIKNTSGGDGDYKTGGIYVNSKDEFFIVGVPSGNDLIFCSYVVKDRQLFIAKFGDTANITAPVVLPSNIQTIGKSPSSLTLNWRKGSGVERLIIASETTPVSDLPQNGQVYFANTIFGSGSQLGVGNFVVYKGNDPSITITGLKVGTPYHFAIIEYEGCAPNHLYAQPTLYVDTTASRHYYTKANGQADDLLTWGTNPDGSGSSPSSFSCDSVVFHVVNNPHAVFSRSVSFTGKGTKVEIGDSSLTQLVTIPDSVTLTATDFFTQRRSKLVVKGRLQLRYLYAHDSTLIVCDSSRGIICSSYFSCYDLEIHTPLSAFLTLRTNSYSVVRNQLVLNGFVDGSVQLARNANDRGELIYLKGVIYGTFTRWIKPAITTGTSGLFPVGVGFFRNESLRLEYTAAPTTGNFVSVRLASYNATKGLPLTDTSGGVSVRINQKATNWWWWVLTLQGGSSGPMGGKATVRITDQGAVPRSVNVHRLLKGDFSGNLSLVGEFAGNAGTPSAPEIAAYNCTFPMSTYYLTYGFDNSAPILPVAWLSFNGKRTDKDVVLHWSISSEQNNSHFEIERSVDGINFTYVGRKDGKGTTNSISDYGFTDRDAFSLTQAQVIYYRLKQVDYNGSYEYSRTIGINNSGQSMGRIELMTFPNPFTEQLNLTLNNVSEGNVTIEVYDLSGRKHYSNVQFAGQGSLTLDLSGLSILNRGVYIIHVQNGNISLAHKLVKL